MKARVKGIVHRCQKSNCWKMPETKNVREVMQKPDTALCCCLLSASSLSNFLRLRGFSYYCSLRWLTANRYIQLVCTALIAVSNRCESIAVYFLSESCFFFFLFPVNSDSRSSLKQWSSRTAVTITAASRTGWGPVHRWTWMVGLKVRENL